MREVEFSTSLVAWQKEFGRQHLPWQNTHNPYAIWLSEIMLQQTQVATVIPYYLKFIQQFPDVYALSAASLDEVLCLWAGLGYYSRARNLHRCAQQVVQQFNGQFPDNLEDLVSLSGIGRSTAAAILCFAFAKRAAILDGNVKRVLTRVFAIHGFPGEKKVEAQLWQLAERLLPQSDGSAETICRYTQGLMDLGATICTRSPHCGRCPFFQTCLARMQNEQAQLPTPRPKKVLPTKQVWMAIFVNHQQVLFEQRISQGIWNGLWSFPEYETKQALLDAVSANVDVLHLPMLKHVFTHFKLMIYPVLIKCTPFAATEKQAWLSFDQFDQFGMPAAIKKIFSSLDASILTS